MRAFNASKVIGSERVKNWKVSRKDFREKRLEYTGLELFFSVQDDGNYGFYRCVIEERDSLNPRRIIGEPFSILVESNTFLFIYIKS